MDWIIAHAGLFKVIGSVLLFIVSTLITNATEIPKIQGAVTWLKLVQVVLQKAMDLLSARAHVGCVGLGGSRWNMPGLPSKPAARVSLVPPPLAIVPFVLLAALGQARAQVPDWSQGPTLAFGRFGFDCKPGISDPCFKMLSAGAGYTLRWNSPARSKDGMIAYMSLDMTALGDFSTLPTGGGLGVAVGPSFYNGLVGVQAGYKLVEFIDGQPTEGLFALEGGRRNVFFLLSVSINFLFEKLPSRSQFGVQAVPPAQMPPNYYRPFQ